MTGEGTSFRTPTIADCDGSYLILWSILWTIYQYHIRTCLAILVEKNEFKHRHGIPWIFICLLMEFHGIPASGDLWNSMDIHAHTAGIPWNSSFWWFVKFHGIPDKASWKSMELQPFMICEIPWNSRLGELEIHGIPGFINSWRSMDFQTRINGIPWISRFYQSVEIHGFSHGWSGIPWIFSLTMWNSMEFQIAFFSLVATRRTHRIPCYKKQEN